ncbi:hypothetical protein GCM10010393_51480 [Streptomyces gobitricini]|uniref:Uncharacterized protein n=1 Tax=Streptomyces gobitricini TaxID=68211 RepID=A0ABN3N0L4_9ACTN
MVGDFDPRRPGAVPLHVRRGDAVRRAPGDAGDVPARTRSGAASGPGTPTDASAGSPGTVPTDASGGEDTHRLRFRGRRPGPGAGRGRTRERRRRPRASSDRSRHPPAPGRPRRPEGERIERLTRHTGATPAEKHHTAGRPVASVPARPKRTLAALGRPHEYSRSSACQGHGVSGKRTHADQPEPDCASRARHPHGGPPIPLGRNDK